MTKEEIRLRIEQRPFKQFKVRLTSGDELLVPTGEHAHLHPNGRTLVVHLDTGGTEIIDVSLIVSLSVIEVGQRLQKT